MSVRVCIIRNPASGSGRRGRWLSELTQILATRGLKCDILTTAGPGDATQLARTAARDSAVVAACGGGGTVREVAAGLIGGDVPLAVIASGTANLVARWFKLPSDAEGTAAMIERGPRQRIDAVEVNGRLFLTVAGIGFDAEVIEELEARRRGNITFTAYAAPIWRAFWNHRIPGIRVRVDDRPLFEGKGMVFVGGLPPYAIGMRLLMLASPVDGLLDVCAFECDSRPRLLRQAWRAIRRKHVGAPGVHYQQGRSAIVERLDEAGMELDGDLDRDDRAGGGKSLLRFEVRPGALTVCMPATNATTG